MRSRRSLLVVGAMLAQSGCAPRLGPLVGAPAPARIPAGQLPPVHRQVAFTWELQDTEISARGEGAARIAPPDSARLDFFLAGGMGTGAAVLIGDTLHAPGGDAARQLVPPPPLLWAALGRLALPPLPDTTARVDGDLLRADIGTPIQWRITFRHDSLVRVERIRGGRIVEWVERAGNDVQYRNESARRTLHLVITRAAEVDDFDASIWTPF